MTPDPNLLRPRLRPVSKPAPDELDPLLAKLLEATSGMGPSLDRAVNALDVAMGFTGNPGDRRRLIRIALHDVYECALRDAVTALRKGEA